MSGHHEKPINLVEINENRPDESEQRPFTQSLLGRAAGLGQEPLGEAERQAGPWGSCPGGEGWVFGGPHGG